MARKVFFSFQYDDVTRANVVRNSDVITRKYTQGARFYDKSLWEETQKQGDLAIKRLINHGLEGSSVTCVLIGKDTWTRRWVRYELLKSMARGNGILGVRIHDVGFSPKQTTDAKFLEALLARPTPASALMRQTLLGALGGTTPVINPFASARRDALAEALSKSAGFANSLAGLAASRRQSSPSLGAELRGVSVSSTTESPNPGPSPFRYLGYTIDRIRGSITFHEVTPNNAWAVFSDVDPAPLAEFPYLDKAPSAGNLESLFRVYSWKQHDGHKNFQDWVEVAARQVGR
jgi:Thoeris protein ThsB, TIR-like domain